MTKQKWIVFNLLMGLFLGCFTSVCSANKAEVVRSSNVSGSQIQEGKISVSAREQLAYSLGVQAYIYGYPLVVMEQTKEKMLKTRAPINQFYYSTTLASPEFRDIVTPNSNTLYFSAWLDLSGGPVVLNVPANKNNRYYTVQMLDMYTNTFQNVSSRSTKGNAGQYVIAGPDLATQSINAPTNSVWLLGRVEVDGQEDLPSAVAFEQQFTLTSPKAISLSTLSTSLSKDQPIDGDHPLAFYGMMTAAIKQNPPPVCDHVLLDQFQPIGIDVEKGFHPESLDSATVAGMKRAAKDGQSIIEQASKGGATENGWIIGYGIGTYGDQFLLRATVAYSGLGANVPAQELYARAFTDGDGRTLTGDKRYVLHFDKNQLPDVYGFWSLSMYGPDFYLVPNPINRYSIGDLVKDLAYNKDGSLDLYIGQKPPKGKESNWLPAPAGDFNLVLRMFAPKPSMLNGGYKVPPVVRTE